MSDDTTHISIGPEELARLHIPTPEAARKQRQGPGGRSLTYVDARYVMGVLDSEFGPGNWQNEFTIGAGGKVGCRIGVRVTFDEGPTWVWKGDGAGETDIEGEKGSFSDAFKRAAVQWGIARDLYGEAPQSQGQAVAAVGPATGAPASANPPQAAPGPQPERPPLPVGTAPYQDVQAAGPGNCPVHGTPWRTTKGDGTPAKRAYCSGKMQDGSYCDQRGPWLNK